MKRLLPILLVMMTMLMPTTLWAEDTSDEPYAVLSEDSTTLTFYFDDQKEARNGMSVGPFDGYPNYQSWYNQRETITKVVFDSSFANCTTLTSTQYWFYQCTKLVLIEGISYLKTDNVTNMGAMFSNCLYLTNLDLSSFNTANVTNMSFMFYMCHHLEILDVSGFNTNKVTNMESMFFGCNYLDSLDVSGFNTDNVYNMHSMFAECFNLKSLDVSSFKTDNVWDMRTMFCACSSLTSLDVSGFKTDNVTEMTGLFADCSGLTSLDVSSFKTDNVTDMSNLFSGCSSLTTIYAGNNWRIDKVQQGSGMFKDCTKLVGGAGTTYDADHTDYTYAHIDGGTSNPGYFTEKNASSTAEPYAVLSEENTVLTFYYDEKKDERNGMDVGPFELDYDHPTSGWYDNHESITTVVFDDSFANCTTLTSTAYWFFFFQNLTTITGINNLKTDNVTDMRYMFNGCFSLTSLNLSSFNTANVTNMSEMFGSCRNLTSLDVSGFNTGNVIDMMGMFEGCIGLTTLDVSNFKTDNVEEMSGMFNNCHNLTSLDVSGFKTDNAKGISTMFLNCSGLTSLDVSGFNTANVTRMNSTFYGCSGLTSLDVSNFKTDNVTEMAYLFSGCSGLTTLDLSNFNISKVIYDAANYLYGIQSMFDGCSKLTTIYVDEGWTVENLAGSSDVFKGCTSLVGGAGTKFSENHIDVAYAHIDGGSSNPGYFTDKNAAEVPDTVETPTFEFEYIWDNYLTIKTETEDAEIYYTMNGRMLEREDANFGYNTLGRYGNWKAWGDNLQEAKSEYNEDVYSGYYGSNYVLKLTSRVDSVMESAQLGYRFNTALTKNDYYTVHFQARSVSGNGQIQFFCQNDTLTTKYRSAADTMAIGKEWADYEYTVKIDNDSTNQIVLNFGGVADTYYIDNVLFGPVISDTINGNLRTHYENPIEMRDNVTITAVAVKDGMAESKTAIYDYFYEGWIMLRDTYEKGRMILQECYGDPNVPLQDVDAMTMRLEDMLYSYYERRTEKRFDDNELLYAAEDMLERVDMIYQMKQGFVIDGVAYHAVDSTQVEVRKPLGYYSIGYKGAIAIAPEVFFNNINFRVTSVTDDAFANSELGAIVWNAEFTVPDKVSTMVNNPNLLVYVNSDALAPKNMTNIVINGVAKNIILVDATTENGSFLVPESFTAEQISYERTFNQETMVGICRGWESIALPFDVQTITHEKQGAISPFGRGDSNKHFWLRRLGSNGFVQADKIEANVPYIIAMPNSSEYSEQYNLPGRVTFSATNAIVPITEERVLSLSDSTIMMIPTMQRLGRSSRYYAINVGEVRGQYLEGSVFERDYREIRPFEAYTTHAENAPAPRFVPIDDIIGGNMTGIEDVRSQMSDGRSDIWYDLNGRRLQKEPAQKGVYLRNGRKVIIR